MMGHKSRSKKFRQALVVALVACLVITGVAVAIVNSYTATWNVVSGGGQTSAGGKYSLTGTIGQGDISSPMTGSGGYTMTDGFWTGLPSTLVYFPAVKKK